MPRVRTEVLKYLQGKSGQGGFSDEGRELFLDLTQRDPINWNVAGAAREMFSVLWRTAWREVHEEADAAQRAVRRAEMLDTLDAYVDGILAGKAYQRAKDLIERARKVVGDGMAWQMRSDADRAALSKLCEDAGIDEETAETEDANGQLMLFTFAGGRKIDRVIAFPDDKVPGRSRSVLARFCTVGQYELHVEMKRENAKRADAAAKVEEQKLAWLLDRAGGDRAAVIFDLRDGAPPPSRPRPTAHP
jgi:hypothetical protein